MTVSPTAIGKAGRAAVAPNRSTRRHIRVREGGRERPCHAVPLPLAPLVAMLPLEREREILRERDTERY